MDEFNRDYNPIDEYSSIDSDTTQNTDFFEDNKNEIETAQEDDFFSAFEKAQKESERVVPPQPVQQRGYYNPPMQPQMPNQYVNTQKPIPPQVPQYYPPQYNQMPPVYNQAPNMYSNIQNQYAAPYNQAPVQQNPYHNPNYNPYQQQYPTKQKAKTPTGTKVLIGILIGLLVVFMVAFFVSCSQLLSNTGTNPFEAQNPLEQYGTESLPDDFIFGEETPQDPFGNFNFAPQYKGEYNKEDITLQADEGNTQIKQNDKKDNAYAPDKNAKGIQFKDVPKDKNDKKYSSQYAYNEVTDAVVSVVCYDGEITGKDEDILSEGTGTVISSDGYIVTNSHVIGDSKQYTINIVLNNSKEYKAKIVGYDTRTDLAVLKIDAKDLAYAKFSDSSKIEVGQDIIAIGNPGGQSFQNSLTKGIVSAVDRELMLSTNVNYIQIDAAINPGNSGGPLCNLYGQVIGINTAKIGDSLYEGMGFAIPSNTVADICDDLIHYGYVKDRVMLGLMGYEVNEEMIATYNVPHGILITEISEGGPLDETDLEEFDILTEINGVEVSTFQDVFRELEKYKAGEKVTLTYYRLES